MAESDDLTNDERSLQLPIAEGSVPFGRLVDATPSEAGMQLLITFARKPGSSWSAHQIVTHASATIIGARFARDRQSRLKERLELYVADGLSWLVARGLIGPAAEHGDQKWRPTTEGFRAAEEGSVLHVEANLRLHSDLHPSIDSSVRLNFQKGDYGLAVFAATRAVEVAVREAAGLEGEQYGVKLMRAAFNPSPKQGPLTSEAATSEQEGIRDLFTGVVGAFRNPISHAAVEYDSPTEAVDIIHFADLLLRIVDRAKQRNGSADSST